MSEEQKQSKFPSEVIDLPSEGKLYSANSPLASGKIEIKYMTAREEDILTSTNLIKKGVVINKLLDSLILTEGVGCDDLILGDKNAVMVAARILAYGPEYSCEVTNPSNGEKVKHEFNLADCPFKELPSNVDYSNNQFKFTLPVSGYEVIFKLLSGAEEKEINAEIEGRKKLGSQVSPELTTRLRKAIISINGDSSPAALNVGVDNMLSKDSYALRQEIQRITPDIEMRQEVNIEGEPVTVDIPMTVEFLWPQTRA